jgi:transcriptional regulator with XRE-family HTH domain
MTYTFDPKKLMTLRKHAFWTQEDLASASGVSARTIQRLERGKGGSLDTWKALAAAFNVDLHQLQSDIPDGAPLMKRHKVGVGTLLAYAGGILGCGYGWGVLFRVTETFQGAVTEHTLLTGYVTVMTALCLIAPFVSKKLSFN